MDQIRPLIDDSSPQTRAARALWGIVKAALLFIVLVPFLTGLLVAVIALARWLLGLG
jgi:hypothetical protein